MREIFLALETAQASRGVGSEADPTRLRDYLGPVICTSPEHQRDFRRRFNTWWVSRCGGRWEDVGEPPAPPPLAERKAYEIVEKTWPWKWWLPAIGVLVVTVALTWTLRVLSPEPAAPDSGDIKAPTSAWSILPLRYRTEIRTALIVLPLLAAFSWLLQRRRGRDLVLERRMTQRRPMATGICREEPEHDLYRGAGFTSVRVEVQRRYTGDRRDLDAEATVESTVQHLGFFTPVYRQRLELPVYLALIDRTGVGDQQARRINELLDQLVEGGVAIDRYHFDRDPRRARPSAGGAALGLAELADVHPRHRLLLFTEGAGLTRAATGHLARWTKRFAAWPERALLTPVPPRHWRRRELEAAAAGFLVLPSTAAGVEAFIALLRGSNHVGQEATVGWHPIPELISQRPERWLEDHQADEGEVRDLRRDLCLYLGRDGYRWLCSLAVYPDLDWYLTLELGLQLRRYEDGERMLTESTLVDLARLPWLRHGSMPDWLRLHLIQDLSDKDEKDVRDLLYELLANKLEPAGSRFRLEVASRDKVEKGKSGRDWRLLLRNLLRAEPPGSRLEDHVFVSYLLGKRPERLQLLAPGNWRRWVYEHGLPALGPRGAVVLTGALLLTVLAFFANDLVLQVLVVVYLLSGMGLFIATWSLALGSWQRWFTKRFLDPGSGHGADADRRDSRAPTEKPPEKTGKRFLLIPQLALALLFGLILFSFVNGVVPVPSVLFVVLGIALLYGGGEVLVDNSIRLARQFGLSNMAIGLTVVAFGTSMPELATNLTAVFGGSPDIAVGNTFGSNFANLGLVLGVSALIIPFTVTAAFLRREVAFMFFVTVLAYPLMVDGLLSRLDGLILLALLAAFLFFSLRSPFAQDEAMAPVDESATSLRPVWLSTLGVILGVVLVVSGAKALVTGATAIATALDVAEGAIGFTLVALATSLPEFAASVAAARKGEGEIAMGNIVGTNIFNLLCGLSLPALIIPIDVARQTMALDYWMMLGISVLLLAFLAYNRKLVRVEGLVLFVAYLLGSVYLLL